MSNPTHEPSQDAELVTRLLAYRPLDLEWGNRVHHVICDEAADAITRLAGEKARLEAEIAVLKANWPISLDGQYYIGVNRSWLARQLMDSTLSEAEALGIVAHAPEIIKAGTARHNTGQPQ